MMKIHHITPKGLDFTTIQKIINEDYKLALSEEAIANINKCREYLAGSGNW